MCMHEKPGACKEYNEITCQTQMNIVTKLLTDHQKYQALFLTGEQDTSWTSGCLSNPRNREDQCLSDVVSGVLSCGDLIFTSVSLYCPSTLEFHTGPQATF